MYGGGAAPMLVLSQNTERESGHKIQSSNVMAAKAMGDIIRTCLGPRAMLKMLMDPMGGIVMTNDGNAILREITVQNPAAKTLIDIARTQDEEVGDGTTSVIVLAAEIMSMSLPFLKDKMHPTTIIAAYRLCLDYMLEVLETEVAVGIDVNDQEAVKKVVQSCLGTKFVSKWSDMICNMAIRAVETVTINDGVKEIDIKRYAKVEKIPGGSIEDSEVLKGVMFNKDIIHPKMKRCIANPRILLLDCGLEYKKGESQTNLEFKTEESFSKMLELEEKFIKDQVEMIKAFKPDLVITEKGVSDLAQHFFNKADISVIRRLRKTDNLRVARAVGATIVNRVEEIKESDVGTGCGLFEIKKIGDEYFTYITECKDPKACTIVLRGASKDVLNEVERNLNDALQVARNIMMNPKVVYGGGASEMALAKKISEKAKTIEGEMQWPFKALGESLEIIPRTLAANCGADTIRTLTALKAKHANEGKHWGIDGNTGKVANIQELNIHDPMAVRMQVYKTAVETAMLLLRIDDIVSGTKKISDAGGAA